jgi:hypothetical protein
MTGSDGSHRLWRRLTGCLVAYTLALHGILAAFAGVPIGTRDLNNDNSLAFELCSHDLAGDALSPQTPSAPAGVDAHCKFCMAGAHSSVVAPASPGIAFIFRSTGVLLGAVADHDPAVSSRYFSKQPRGPPLTA